MNDSNESFLKSLYKVIAILQDEVFFGFRKECENDEPLEASSYKVFFFGKT